MMKVLATCLVLLVAGVASQTDPKCSQICTGSCDVTKKLCDVFLLVGPICDINLNICTAQCGLVCSCVDSCDAQCSPAFTACRTNAGGNPVALAQCSIQFQICGAVCANQCTIGQITSKIGGK